MASSHEYYSRHYRRTSSQSQSQTSLPDQLKQSCPIPTNRSEVLLPAVAYSKSPPPRQRILSISNNRPVEESGDVRHSADRSQQGNPENPSTSSYAALPQQNDGRVFSIGIKSNDEHFSENGTLTDGQPQPWRCESQPFRTTLVSKGRKSSVKNLVAQINASAIESPPPLPGAVNSNGLAPDGNSRAVSRSSSRQTSQQGFLNEDFGKDAATAPTARSNDVFTIHPRRPLFGEVASGTTSIHSPGYGIIHPKRRTGSESSPMHSPNAMFPGNSRDSHFFLSTAVYDSSPSTSRPEHRRTRSEITSSGMHVASLENRKVADNGSEGLLNVRNPFIPSAGSHLDQSTLADPFHGGNLQPNGILQRNHKLEAISGDAPSQQPNGHLEDVTGKITSPERRGKTPRKNQNILPQGSKSPLLRAKILVPPTKISPPLRGSRQRLPVSSATTAASRARMAEKFTEMQRRNEEKRRTQRRPSRPPELSDIDLKARRLKIMQKVTASRENDEMKKSLQVGKQWTFSRATSTSSMGAKSQIEDESDEGLTEHDEEAEQDTGETFVEGYESDGHATQQALDLIDVDYSHDANEIDSPTLGYKPVVNDKSPIVLQTQLLTSNHMNEPSSAVTNATVESEFTRIDPEPQQESVEPHQNTNGSILGHIRHLRDQSPAYQESVLHPQNSLYQDRSDVQSVNLILRNTTYLDDEEAISKGYRQPNANSETVPQIPRIYQQAPSTRDSWTSSIHENIVDDSNEQGEPSELVYFQQEPREYFGVEGLEASQANVTQRHTMQSDAYTIINIVLQEHSASGLVDQQFAENIYGKMMSEHPEVEEPENYDPEKIEQFCLQEIHRRNTIAGSPVQNSILQNYEDATPQPEDQGKASESYMEAGGQVSRSDELEDPSWTLARTTYQIHHRYKSSLDSADDWADASPSVADWARFAADQNSPDEHHVRQSEPNISLESSKHASDPEGGNGNFEDLTDDTKGLRPPALNAPFDPEGEVPGPDEFGTAIIRPPSHSPPLPPKDVFPSIDQTVSQHIQQLAVESDRLPRVPSRTASLGQTRTRSVSRSMSFQSKAEVVAQESQSVPSSADVSSSEVRKLKQRLFVIRELINTENVFQRDMKVLCDIYKETASAVLSEEDSKTIFGNVEQISDFALEFLSSLRQTTKPVYSGSNRDKKPLMNGAVQNASTSEKPEDEAIDVQKHNETRIGAAFLKAVKDMEKVYGEFIRGRQAAYARLEVLQKNPPVVEWLKECKDNSSDITDAWNLDSLLVKPIQRITKYPLLLKELVDATSEDNPDLSALRKALSCTLDINSRINQVKKHEEALDQAINRKRGQSDVRTNLQKAFGRRAEKIKQHVGMTETFEDTEYDKLRTRYENNFVQMMVVANDLTDYQKGITRWVSKWERIAVSAEAWVDVGHSSYPQEESKLRHLTAVIRNVVNIALPDHVEHLQRKCVAPIQSTVELLSVFSNNPKSLLGKRDKRLVDYAQMRGRKERGEKLDRKTSEKIEQWEALNKEAKDRMRKCLRASSHMIQTCLGHFVHLQMTWSAMIQQKFSNVMGIDLKKLELNDIIRDFKGDFEYQEGIALALSICNGSLLIQTANMASHLTPSSTLNGDDSPRQPSWSSQTNKRSISITSESSNVPTLDLSSRPSGTYTNSSTVTATTLPPEHFDRPYPFPSRNRATSAVSPVSRPFRGADISVAAANAGRFQPAEPGIARPGTSPGLTSPNLHSSEQDVFAPPRLSIETYSPLVQSFNRATMPPLARHDSNNTFFSTAPTPTALLTPSYGHRGVSSSRNSHHSSFSNGAAAASDSPLVSNNNDSVPNSAMETPSTSDPKILFTVASVYEFNIDRARRDNGFPYLSYVVGEIFDVMVERGELWLAKNQDDKSGTIGWIWNKHFAKLAT